MGILIRNALDREGYVLNGTGNNCFFVEKIVQSISGHNRIRKRYYAWCEVQKQTIEMLDLQKKNKHLKKHIRNQMLKI